MLLSTDQHVQVNIGVAQIENSSSEKLLGVTIDTKLTFVKHMEQYYNLFVFSTLNKLLNKNKLKKLINK